MPAEIQLLRKCVEERIQCMRFVFQLAQTVQFNRFLLLQLMLPIRKLVLQGYGLREILLMLGISVKLMLGTLGYAMIINISIQGLLRCHIN